MNRKLQPPEQALEAKPNELQPNGAKVDATETLAKINGVLHQEAVEYWSCYNGAYIGIHCGCEDATDYPWGAPGASPSNPIYYSNNRRHWCAPIRVAPIEGGVKASPIVKEFVPTDDGRYYGAVESEPLPDHPKNAHTPSRHFVMNANGTAKIWETLPKGAKVVGNG
jgi:hypothetical protein